ncbi:MAG: hypothetical protein GY866_36595 [Proteobacteria bacterium]|nr:hypothetical protein [Pseudomonadota bacterium]
MKLKRIVGFAIVSIALIFAVVNCKKDKESTITVGTSNFASGTVTKMQAVSDGFVPDSMETSSASSASIGYASGSRKNGRRLFSEDEDPCAETDLWGCQAILVKLYIDFSNQLFDMSILFLNEMATHLGQLENGQSGTANTGDGVTIHYSKISDNQWDMLAVTALGTFLDMSVNENSYTFKVNFSNNVENTENLSTLELQVSYINDTNWIVNSIIMGSGCDPDDERAPERIKVIMSRSGNLYTGKAMLYSPRWAYFNPDPTCASVIDDDHSLNLYTDFVANDAAAKVKVYMMKRNVSDLDSMDVLYSMADICSSYWDNFNLFANAAECENDTNFTTLYPNPFCTTGTQEGETNWGDDCTGTNSTIQAAEYGADNLWATPSNYYQQTVTLRTSLD